MSKIESVVELAGASRVVFLLVVTVCLSVVANAAILACAMAWRGRAVTPIWTVIVGTTWLQGAAACAALVLRTQAARVKTHFKEESLFHVSISGHVAVLYVACAAFLLVTLIGAASMSMLSRARQPFLSMLFTSCGALLVLTTALAFHGIPTLKIGLHTLDDPRAFGLPPNLVPVIAAGTLALAVSVVMSWRHRSSPVSWWAVALAFGWLLAGMTLFGMTRDVAHDARITRRWPREQHPRLWPAIFILPPGVRCGATESEALYLNHRYFLRPRFADRQTRKALTESIALDRDMWTNHPYGAETNVTVDAVRIEVEPTHPMADLVRIVEACHDAGYRRIRMRAYETVKTPTRTVGVERRWKPCEAEVLLDRAGVDPLDYATWGDLYAAANAAPLILAIEPPPPDPDD